jgi:NTP pyrophosphatase (non-canonical NTP hydrolase)
MQLNCKLHQMPEFQPERAVEIVAPQYGSAYRIGGRLVLTCKHLFDNNNNDCKVRFRSSSNYSDKQDIAAKVIWKAPDNIDIALVELPETVEICDAVSFGELPEANNAKKVKFDFLGFPQFLRYSEDDIKYATGLHIEGTIDVANRAPHNRLLLNIKDSKEIQPTDKQLENLGENQSPWEGTSGSAIVCNGLVIGVQSRHPIIVRPASLEAESLARVYDNKEWCEILEKHDIDTEPKPVISVSLISHSYRNQAPPKPSYFVERPEVSIKVKELLLSAETAETGTLVISAIYGLGGIGKSTLAAALAQEKDVQAYFPDGIFWATLGQQPDILSFLHGWIQALGDYDFKPTGIDAASLQLRTLLADKKALLVVDDLWNAEDVEPFRVAGDGCKLLVTTREAPVIGAIRYDLDIMTETQSLELLTAYLKHELTLEDRKQAKILAKIVGYLPLALELTAAQVEDGIPWAELLEELRAEIANLEILDRLEAEDATNEEKRKHYSLIASFNLSLKRLSSQRLQQFIWLGVLPDDVTITEKMATTLWDCRLTEARKTLRYLRGKALLLTGVSSEQITNYRVHDLLHDLARNLLQASPHPEREYQLPGLGLSISEAHQQLLTRYQRQTKNGLWHSLEDDGYIYNQLIWHLEKAGKIAEIHQLLREETAEGGNGWYSKCEKEGKTATFIKDVSRAWQLAEADFANNPSQSIALQVRYGLITTSLNSLAGNIPPELIALLIQHKIWTPAQGLAYVRQNQDFGKQAKGLRLITPYLTPTLLPEALEVTRAIGDEDYRATALTGLAPHFPEVLPEDLAVVRAIGDEYKRAEALTGLAPYLPESLFPEALAVARAIGYERYREEALTGLAPHLPESLFPEALAVARAIGNEYREEALTGLAPHLPESLFPEALAVARENGWPMGASVLSELAPYLPESLLSEALEIAYDLYGQSDWGEGYYYVRVLTGLAPRLPEVLPQALDVAYEIKDYYARAMALTGLAPYFPEVLPEALDAARSEESQYYRGKAWTELAPHLPESLLPEALEVARGIWDKDDLVNALTKLAPHLPEVLPEALEVARAIGDERYRAKALTGLAPHLPEVLPEALEVVRAIGNRNKSHFLRDRVIGDGNDRADVLIELAPHLPESLFPKALEVARAIDISAINIKVGRDAVDRDEFDYAKHKIELARVKALTGLAPYLPESLLPEALEIARAIGDKSHCAKALTGLAPYLPESLLPEALEVARAIGNEYNRARALTGLAPYLPEVLPEALDAARATGDELFRVEQFTRLAPYFPEVLPEALEVARAIGDEDFRAEALTGLAPYLPESLLLEALEVARAIGNEDFRAKELQSPLTKVLTPDNVDQSFWEKKLHALETLTRPHFLETIPNLVPLILHFGGVVALREVHQAIREVSRWWK